MLSLFHLQPTHLGTSFCFPPFVTTRVRLVLSFYLYYHFPWGQYLFFIFVLRSMKQKHILHCLVTFVSLSHSLHMLILCSESSWILFLIHSFFFPLFFIALNSSWLCFISLRNLGLFCFILSNLYTPIGRLLLFLTLGFSLNI